VEDFKQQGALPNGMDFIHVDDMKTISASLDFLGINYYNRGVKRADAPNNDPQIVFSTPKTPENWTEMDWENYPDGLANVISRYYFNYQPLKIYVTENGASYSTAPDANGNVRDELRIKYYREHLAAAHKTLQVGVPLAGYFAWSLMDNFEWARGYAQRFGIVWVNYETQERIIKDSGKWYKTVIKKNGF
jgi:beta-glucosidase